MRVSNLHILSTGVNTISPIPKINSILKPKPLELGDTIGIFTPSWPANYFLKEKYLYSLRKIYDLGFKYEEGFLTKNLAIEGYRSATPKLRAQEFMELLCHPKVKCLMATIGGWNSSSLIPYLDFEEIKKQKKIICGYSDITSLHLAILKNANLSTIYGPTLVPIFGEYPSIHPYSLQSFLDIISNTTSEKRLINPPEYYNRQFIDAMDENWQIREASREYQTNENWKVLTQGKCSGRLIVANLETLLTLAGTPIFPDLKDKILILEDEEARFSIQERAFYQLLQLGVFDVICGLIISKPFKIISEGANFSYEELILEVIGRRNFPIVTNFDCGHTFPSMSLPIGVNATLDAHFKTGVTFSIDENAVEF